MNDEQVNPPQLAVGSRLKGPGVGTTLVVFGLEQDDDGYPPYSTESVRVLPCRDGTYVVQGIPTFARGVSRGDVVSADDHGDVRVFSSVVQRSGHSTVRVFVENDPRMEEPKHLLRALGCDVEDTRRRCLLAVDVPPSADYGRVLAALREGRAKHGWGIQEAHVSPEHEAMVEDGAEGDPASFMDAPQEASAAGGRSDSGTHPTPLWCMLPSEFAAAARRGRLHMATGAPPLNGSGQTALSFGESEGFSAEDIAHFYVARRTRNGAAYTEERLRLAYEDFVRDALFESKEVPPEVALRVGVITVLGPAPPRASGVVDHGGLWRPLAFISEGAAAAWLDSIDDGVRHRQGLRVASIRANDEEHFYILAGNDSA